MWLYSNSGPVLRQVNLKSHPELFGRSIMGPGSHAERAHITLIFDSMRKIEMTSITLTELITSPTVAAKVRRFAWTRCPAGVEGDARKAQVHRGLIIVGSTDERQRRWAV